MKFLFTSACHDHWLFIVSIFSSLVDDGFRRADGWIHFHNSGFASFAAGFFGAGCFGLVMSITWILLPNPSYGEGE